MATRLGTIAIDLVANTVSFSDAMSKASQIALNSSSNIQRSFKLVSAAATAMAAGVLASFTAATAHAQSYALEMSRFAEKTGTSTEMMSRLAYSAKSAGVPIDMLKGAMERLARTAGGAMGGQQQLLAAYQALGISAKDLHGPLSDSGDLLVTVAKRLSTMRESTLKTALEQKILGRTGSELNPMLNTLSQNFEDNSRAADKFGIVINQLQADKAKKFNQALIAMQSMMLGLEVRLLNGVSPALIDVGQKITGLVTSANGMKTIDAVASGAATAIRATGSAFQFLFDHATAVKRVLEGYIALRTADLFLQIGSSALRAGTGIDAVGTALVKLGTKTAGLATIGPLLTRTIASAAATTAAWMSLARTEGVIATGAYAAREAFKSFSAAMLANPATAVAAALALVGVSFYKMTQNILDQKDVAATWGDWWNARIMAIGHNLTWLRGQFKAVAQLSGFSNGPDSGEQAAMKDGFWFSGAKDKQLIVEAKRKRLAQEAAANAPATPAKLPGQTDAPIIPAHLGPEKIDPVQKKLLDLRLAAEAAQKALADVGKRDDFKRQDEAAAEAKKTIADLNLELARHHKTLSAGQEAQIKAFITTKVNAESQARFREELVSTTRELLSQVDAMGVHRAALGAAADQVRDAAIRENAQRQDAGKDPEWLARNVELRKQRDEAFGKQFDEANASQDSSKLDDLRLQIALQTALNGELGKGKTALDAIALSNQQAEITADFAKRGDTDKQSLQTALDTAKELFDLKQQQALLERAADFNPTQRYKDEVQSLEEMKAAAAEAGIQIDALQYKAARQDAWDSYRKQIDDVKLKMGSMKDGVSVFFDEMTLSAKSAAEQMREVLGSAMESLNHNLVNLITGQKASFADFFRGIAQQVASIGLQKMETSIVSSILGPSHDPTAEKLDTTNGLLQQIYGVLSIQGQPASQTGSVLGSSDSASDGSFFSSLLGTFGKIAAPAFGGHRALGGDVKAGMTYDVGEMGRERFTPSMDGKITPNNQMGGGPIAVHVDARGATDPAAVEMAAKRAVAQAAPSIIAASLRASKNDRSRTPGSRA